MSRRSCDGTGSPVSGNLQDGSDELKNYDAMLAAKAFRIIPATAARVTALVETQDFLEPFHNVHHDIMANEGQNRKDEQQAAVQCVDRADATEQTDESWLGMAKRDQGAMRSKRSLNRQAFVLKGKLTLLPNTCPPLHDNSLIYLPKLTTTHNQVVPWESDLLVT